MIKQKPMIMIIRRARSLLIVITTCTLVAHFTLIQFTAIKRPENRSMDSFISFCFDPLVPSEPLGLTSQMSISFLLSLFIQDCLALFFKYHYKHILSEGFYLMTSVQGLIRHGIVKCLIWIRLQGRQLCGHSRPLFRNALLFREANCKTKSYLCSNIMAEDLPGICILLKVFTDHNLLRLLQHLCCYNKTKQTKKKKKIPQAGAKLECLAFW